MPQSIKTKRVVTVVLLFALLATVGYGVYWFLSGGGLVRGGTDAMTGKRIIGKILDLLIRDNGDGQIGTTTNDLMMGTDTGSSTPPTPTPTTTGKRLRQIADFPVVGAHIGEDDDSVRYFKKDGGDYYESSLVRNRQDKLSNTTIIGMIGAEWSTPDRVAVFYLDNELLKAVIHAGTSTMSSLPQNIRSFSWSPDHARLAYFIKNGEKSELIVANSSGAERRVILSTPINDVSIHWKSAFEIALHTLPSKRAEGYIFVVDIRTGSMRKVVGPQLGIMGKWSPDGTKVAVFRSLTRNEVANLEIYTASGREITTFPVKTLPEKCAWFENNRLYCAVPRNGLDINWPDSYFRGEVNTEDKMLLLDLERQSTLSAFSEGAFDITDLRIGSDQQYAVFIDRKDGTLWSYELVEEALPIVNQMTPSSIPTQPITGANETDPDVDIDTNEDLPINE